MSVMVAVPDSVQGEAALAAAVDEARLLDTDLIVIPLGVQSSFDTAESMDQACRTASSIGRVVVIVIPPRRSSTNSTTATTSPASSSA